MSIALPPAIIIAAGGEGRRMGGAKPQALLAGQSLLGHAIGWATRHSDACAIALRDAAQIRGASHEPGLPLLVDAAPGLGPVSALASAMRFAAAHGRAHTILIGCDQPFLPDDLPERLTCALGDHGVAMPVAAGKDQPLASLWRVDARGVADFIAGGGRSLWRLADRLGAVRVAWAANRSGHDPFANINDPATLARFARSAGADDPAQDCRL